MRNPILPRMAVKYQADIGLALTVGTGNIVADEAPHFPDPTTARPLWLAVDMSVGHGKEINR